MHIYSADQLKKADDLSVQKQGISHLELMERAAGLAFQELVKEYKEHRGRFVVLCGVGNNGGDGLVIARKLMESGYRVEIAIIEYSTTYSAEFKANYDSLQKEFGLSLNKIGPDSKFPEIRKTDVVVDAIFGTGLNRAPAPWLTHFFDFINQSQAPLISIDVPSGMFVKSTLSPQSAIVKARKTITFQSPKLAFYLPDTAGYTGEIKVVDIGLDSDFLARSEPEATLVAADRLAAWIKPRKKFSHKGSYGHALLVGGSRGMVGSMVLATKAALRSGAGKVTAWVPKCGYEILQITAPEAMVHNTADKELLQHYNTPTFTPQSIGFGMGAGTQKETAEFFKNLLQNTKKPMLIDADGLNLLAYHAELKELIPKDSVLTPHLKELERLVGTWKNDWDKIEKAKEFSAKYNCILVVKGAFTRIFYKDKIYINTTGNPGMATGGSGDVLSGLLTGLLAQSYSPLQAAVLGVYLHGLAGDIAIQETSEETLIAGDLIANFGKAFQQIKKTK